MALASLNLEDVAWAAEKPKTDGAVEDRVQALIPELEAYIAGGMKEFDVPGLAIGIVARDRLVYAKGFRVRSKSGGGPVDTRTIFQIGSTTKAFLAATLAIMVDRGKLRWDDRVLDLDPDFQLKVEATKKLIESNGLEAPEHERSLDLLHTAPRVRVIPVVLLTSDKRSDFGAGGSETWSAWRTAQDRLPTLLNAKHVSDTNSGHAIQMEKPRLVIETIREIVEAVRSGRRQLAR